MRRQCDVSGLITFAAVRYGRQIRAIGFQHERLQSNGFDGVPNRLSGLERNDAADTQAQAKLVNVRLRLLRITGKAVDDAAHALAPFLTQDRDEIFERVAMMEDDRISALAAERNLRAQHALLQLAWA